MPAVCVCCGSRTGHDPDHAASARIAAGLLVRAGHAIVYGGGATGIMGIVAEAVLESGGQLTGVIPECLATPELMHGGVADMRVVVDMHARKQLMHRLADAYVILPGGYGTMEELFEAVTWNQLGIHRIPIGVLNCNGYYDELRDLCDRMVSHGFLDESNRRLLTFCPDPETLCAWVASVTCTGV